MIRVLMVETDARLVSGVARGLVRYDAAVSAVETFELAVETTRSQRFALVIVDSDLVSAADLRAFVGTPLVVTTSLLGPEQARDFSRLARILRKPYTSTELSSILLEEIELVPEPSCLLDSLCRGHASRASFCLRVGSGEIHLANGEIVHAVLAGARGEAALAEILLRGGAMVRGPSLPAPRSIERPFRALLLDALARAEATERRSLLKARLRELYIQGRLRRSSR